MFSIQSQWEEFSKLFRNTISPKQYMDMKIFFYAGFTSALKTLKQVSETPDFDDDTTPIIYYELWTKETMEFEKEISEYMKKHSH